MFGGFDRKMILKIIVQLAEAQYDSITNLEQMTVQELSDIHKVITSIQQERELEKSQNSIKTR